MSSITGGKISFSRTVQPVQYESARAEAELSFVLEEGEDPVAVLREWGDKVKGVVLEIVGQSSTSRPASEDRGSRDEPSSPARSRFRRRNNPLDDDIPF